MASMKVNTTIGFLVARVTATKQRAIICLYGTPTLYLLSGQVYLKVVERTMLTVTVTHMND